MRFLIALALLTLVVATLCHASEEPTLGVPVLFRGSLVGCAEQPKGLLEELASLFGERVVYFFGLRGCPECEEMEYYLRRIVREGELAYIDVSEHRNLFMRLLKFLSSYVEEKYLSEVPIVVIKVNGSATLISVGRFRDDLYWMRALSGEVPERCHARFLSAETRSIAWMLGWSFALGLASALSPCVLYIYTTLLLSYAPYGGSPRKLVSFVLGLGLGYLVVLMGLYGLVLLLRPFAWVFFIAFGAYMILHARGILGCPVGGRACRDISYYGEIGATLLGGLFPFLLGLIASVSAAPCSAGYFVLLQATADGGGTGASAALLTSAYLAAYVTPYVLLSLLSSRMVNVVSKLSSKAALAELVGGIALIIVGLYLALGSRLV